jgi:8-oxo-dGTP diphosphatase
MSSLAKRPPRALVREGGEELGVNPIGAIAAGQMDFADDHDGPSTLHLFRVEAWVGGEPRIANDEHVQLEWFWPEEAGTPPNLALAEYRAVVVRL